jgi:hypothetical protein
MVIQSEVDECGAVYPKMELRSTFESNSFFYDKVPPNIHFHTPL